MARRILEGCSHDLHRLPRRLPADCQRDGGYLLLLPKSPRRSRRQGREDHVLHSGRDQNSGSADMSARVLLGQERNHADIRNQVLSRASPDSLAVLAYALEISAELLSGLRLRQGVARLVDKPHENTAHKKNTINGMPKAIINSVTASALRLKFVLKLLRCHSDSPIAANSSNNLSSGERSFSSMRVPQPSSP